MHVQHVDPGGPVENVGREQEGRVVVGALVAGGVDVALHLEAAIRSHSAGDGVRAHQLCVAVEPQGGLAVGVVS